MAQRTPTRRAKEEEIRERAKRRASMTKEDYFRKEASSDRRTDPNA